MNREPRCPWCYSKEVEAEFVDVGVGMQQVSGYQCFICQAHEFNCYTDPGNTTPEEDRLGFLQGMPYIWLTARQRHSNYMLSMRRMMGVIALLMDEKHVERMTMRMAWNGVFTRWVQ